MDNTIIDDDMPAEIDFSKGIRGLHYFPAEVKTFAPVSIESGVWDYFHGKAEEKGVPMSELLTEVLRREIGTTETLK